MDLHQLTSTAARRLPTPCTDLARDVALHTGRATWRARLAPSFLVIGAQRCGTTTMFRLLSAHPHLVRPPWWKGTGYFDDDYQRGPAWYRGHFPLRATTEALHPGPTHTFECSGYYLFHPLAAERIAADLPGVQVVAMVRDPVERAWSAYRHERARGFETLGFDDAVAAEPRRLADEEDRLREDPTYHSDAHRHFGYLGRGEYARQLERYVECLGVDRVHVLDADHFFARPRSQFAGLQQALGLPVWLPPHVPQENARPGAGLDAARRRLLARHFAPHDEQLAALTGRSPSWRVRAAS